MARDLLKMNHYLVNAPLHFYTERADDGTEVLRHIRVQQRVFNVPADGVTIDTVPPDSVGSRQIEDGAVMLDDLNPEVKDSIADRVTQDDLNDFNV
jgi:hypothetical protein